MEQLTQDQIAAFCIIAYFAGATTMFYAWALNMIQTKNILFCSLPWPIVLIWEFIKQGFSYFKGE